MDLQVAAVDAVVVGDHHLGELDVLVRQRLQHSVELLDDEVEAAERAPLELHQLFAEVLAGARLRRRRGACGARAAGWARSAGAGVLSRTFR